MKFLLPATFVILLGITNCAPAPEIVATAMAQTQTALPTNTPVPTTAIFTFTPETPASTPTEILTPTPTPTSTPDLRVIEASPEDIVCTKDDLPVDGKYFLQSPGNVFGNSPFWYFCGHCTNNQISGAFAPEYIIRTKRVDGWLNSFKKANNSYPGFNSLACYVQMFRTIEGAQLAVKGYSFEELYPQVGYEIFESPDLISIGNVSVGISNTSYSDHLAYGIEFSYKNYAVTVSGLNGTTKLDDLYYVAQNILKKLENAPLSAP